MPYTGDHNPSPVLPRQYVSNAEYKQQKTALTRAVNSKDPLKVLGAVEKVLAAWSNKAWPDDWSRWSVALYDAWCYYERSDARYDDDRVTFDQVCGRFSRAYDRF